MSVVRITITSSNNPNTILRALKEPSELFFKDIPDIVSFRSYSELGIYEVKIRLRRFLAVVVDTIHFIVKQEGNRIIYESLEQGKFRASFSVSEELGITRIHAEIFYNTPLKGSVIDTAVENIFKKFIWNLDEKAPRIVSTIQHQEIERASKKTSEETTVRTIIDEKKAEKPVEIEVHEKATRIAQLTHAGEINCKTCLLYEESVSMCTYLVKKIENPGKPLCGGEKYIRALI